MKPILVVVHSPTWFVEMFRVACLLKRSTDYEPLIFWATPHHRLALERALCREAGLSCLDLKGKPLVPDEISPGTSLLPKEDHGVPGWARRPLNYLRRLASKVCNFIKGTTIGQIFVQISEFKRRHALVQSIIEQYQPAALVLAGDNVGYDTAVFINTAHKKACPVLLVPSTMSNGLEEAEVYYHAPEYWMDKWLNRLAGWLYPRWIREHRGRRLLRVPGTRLLAMELSGLAPPLPWIFCSGHADAIAVESERMRQYYLDCGLPERQLRLTGSLADDEMVKISNDRERIRRELYAGLGLPLDRPMLLSALPPDFLYLAGGRPECDFKTYPELVEFWVKSMARAKGYNAVVCLHPSVRYEDYQYIESWGVKIARRGTAELIPLSDIYIASVSSTIRWAIACGVPVINYDVYKYHYTDYLGVDGVLILEGKDEFRATITHLAEDTAYYDHLKREQREVAQQWGMFDGQVGRRMLALIDELVVK